MHSLSKTMDDSKQEKIMSIISYIAYEIILNDVSEDEEEELTTNNDKINNFAEVIVPKMDHKQFKRHFRLSCQTFEALLKLCKKILPNEIRRGRPSITLEKELLLTIWCLANCESFRSVANRFGITKSTCWLALYRTCRVLIQVNNRFKIISWPTEERALITINKFKARYHIPGVIGAIDGNHIRIIAPKENHTSYINRKGYHSLILQGICDATMIFTDVYCGEAGSLHDTTVFRKSVFYKKKFQVPQNFPDNSHIIGDLAYTLHPNLLVGFKDYGYLSERQKNYNLLLSKTRVVIENAFALLKGRFRRMKSLDTVRLDLSSLLIFSACMFHNICIYSSDNLEDICDINVEIVKEQNNNPYNIIDNNIDENNINAATKRDAIVNLLPVIR